ncbi:MAG: hypothetical protein HYR72_22530 [Deltaproteobacteria bacterium]|nr:hypothetical protein [Deltaproteobacteria bacterium]MBI3390625.1 hypothetical protein [Deltaproteobacteria bacterium]
MDESRFKIVFEKLAEVADEGADQEATAGAEEMRVEIDEIAELRRMVLETTEPDQKSFTTT